MPTLGMGMRYLLTLLLAGFLLLPAHCFAQSIPNGRKKSVTSSPAARPAKAVRTVIIDRFMFTPPTLTVRAGETVVWKNLGMVPHTATVTKGKAFDSGVIEKGASWRYKASKKGTFEYLCTLHPNMKGKLIVR